MAVAALAAAALVDTLLTWSPPAWRCAALIAGFALASALAWRAGRAPVTIAREGDEWYLCEASPDGSSDPLSWGAASHDPLVLLAPAYRSSWLIRLRLCDAADRVRTLEVWSDALDPAAFSYLHLACLFDAEGERSRRRRWLGEQPR